ncbi:8412_t:CDS:2, partial [Paraglomus brasilianum]
QIEEIDDDIVDERRQKLRKLVHVNINDDAKNDKVVDESLMKSCSDQSDDNEQVFRLFSTSTPQKIVLKSTSIKEYNGRVSYLRQLKKQQLISL